MGAKEKQVKLGIIAIQGLSREALSTEGQQRLVNYEFLNIFNSEQPLLFSI